MEEYVKAAISKKLNEITFLEHMEEGIRWKKRTWLTGTDFDAYFAEGRRLQSVYRDRIRIRLGVECGYNPASKKRLRERLAQRSWDEVGLSCHFIMVANHSQHLNLFTRNPDELQLARTIGAEKLLHHYFELLYEAVQNIEATVLCHLDGALRHMGAIHLTPFHYKQIDALLQLVAEKEMKLEINSSGLRIRGEQFPSNKILKTARAYNIDLQLGSDAHRPEDVGFHFNDLT